MAYKVYFIGRKLFIKNYVTAAAYIVKYFISAFFDYYIFGFAEHRRAVSGVVRVCAEEFYGSVGDHVQKPLAHEKS